ncbi:MAG: folate-binding protein YgfZ [Proteobacteria bacterium]|nr:folate-binding protein YgfZ [Pseudomonadota bacterium]
MSCHYTKLVDEALLHIVGPDTLTFLQGQTTCDTRTVDVGQTVPGAYCTPKGRVVCDFLLCQIAENHYALRMRQDIVDTSAAVFAKFIVFSKAQLLTDQQSWQVFGCWGDEAHTALHSALSIEPKQSGSGERYSCSHGEGFVLIQTDAEGRQFECYINTDSHPELVEKLAATMSPGDANSWKSLQIEQGLGRIEAATVEEFIPQMLNYDLTGYVSFDKGCYTGQEVVARMHYRGKPKRRLYRANLNESHPLPAGAPLFNAGSPQSVGTVVNSAVGADGAQIALIVAPVTEEENLVYLADSEGPALSYHISPINTG